MFWTLVAFLWPICDFDYRYVRGMEAVYYYTINRIVGFSESFKTNRLKQFF